MRQILSQELLDDDAATAAEIARSLDDLWGINRRLGGISGWSRLWANVERVMHDGAKVPGTTDRHLRLLDIGAGTGQMAAAHVDWWRGRGWQVTGFALDRRIGHLRPGLAPGIFPLAGDAMHLPFPDASVDFVVCNLFLHHFHDSPSAPMASGLLGEMRRIARRGVVINDLERSWWPYLAIRALGWRVGRVTRYDGPRSVRQAYTRAELEGLARASGAERYRAFRLPWFRLGLILWSEK